MLDDLFDSNGSACDEVATSSAKAVDLLSVFDSDDEQQDVHIPSCAEPRSDKLAQDDVIAIEPCTRTGLQVNQMGKTKEVWLRIRTPLSGWAHAGTERHQGQDAHEVGSGDWLDLVRRGP